MRICDTPFYTFSWTKN